MGKPHDEDLMHLLWRSETTGPPVSSPGPKPRFDVDDIVEAAIAVADARPVDGVTMRGVAERLGVTAMTLYGYVSDKDALVSLAYDAIHAEMPDLPGAEGGWRDGVMQWAEDLMDLYVRHPWVLRVSYARPVLGPNEQRVLESLLQVLMATGLEPGRLRRMVGMLFHAVRGTALTIAEAREADEKSGLTEGEWWQESSVALSSVVPDFPDRFPNTMWLLSSGTETTPQGGVGYVEREASANLRDGLQILLDGVEAAVPG